MFSINNLFNNANMQCINQLGQYRVFEHQKDLSVSPYNAETAYFSAEMNVRRRQVLVELNNTSCKLQAGATQSGVSAGNFLGKALGAAVTGETMSKPEYTGQGYVMLEPTYKHILLVDVAQWGQIVLDDGLFLACDSTLQHKVVSRKTLSSAALGGEGLFNLSLSGQGIAVLESPVPQQELIMFNLQDDEVKIDGNMAIAWSSSLDFTVEKSSKSLVGSAVSGEGLVNVYRGSGKIWLAPVLETGGSAGVSSPQNAGETASEGKTGSAAARNDTMSKIEKFGKFMDKFS